MKDDFSDAAAEIDRLRAENERLREALDDMISRVEQSWERRDLAPDSDLEAVDLARKLLSADGQ
jgi:uncharacterized protein with PhoU and TrkA domain